MVERSRRRFLATSAAGVAGVAGLAGCNALPLGDSNPEPPDLPDSELEAIGATPIPDPPSAFPVSLDEGGDHHRERARELLAQVPESPEVPNGAVTAKLRERRTELASDLSGEATGERRHDLWSATPALDRLRHWRDRRGDAAELLGAYRAATGEFDPDAVEAGRDDLQSALAAFRQAWAYGGPDPVTAVAVHATIEGLVGRVENHVDPWPGLPATPQDAPFEAGGAVGEVERARAALTDATAIRNRFEDASDTWSSHAAAIDAATESLRGSVFATKERVQGYLDAGPSQFDRDLRYTPAEALVRNTAHTVEWRTREASDARQRGHYAQATLASTESLAAIEAFEAVVDAVEAGRYGRIEDVATVREQRDRTVQTLELAWDADPRPLAVDLTDSMAGTLVTAYQELRGERSREPDAARAVANLAQVAHYASFVPAATRHFADVLTDAGE
jgi:hypothetical protein